jgi:hypothetical protein
MFYVGWNSEQALERQNLTMLVRFLTVAPEAQASLQPDQDTHASCAES